MVEGVLHDGLRKYLAEFNTGGVPRNSDGSVSLIFDGQYRVTCLPLAYGDLLLEARILQLPDEARARRITMEALLEQAGSRLGKHTDRIAFAPGEQMLVLQQTVPAQADRAQFISVLDGFVNALAGWRRLAGVL